MALPLYLALTAAEFQNCSHLPEHTAWMACHYSPYGLGLSNIPSQLPEEAMVILNDRTPPQGHDPELIVRQLRELADVLHYKYILLDFQRPGLPENTAVAKALVAAALCPIGVSELYARELDAPVFLPPVPPHVPLREYLAPWQGREIWLEAALGGEVITVTEKGSSRSPLASMEVPETAQEDPVLHCHYHIRTFDNHIDFTLWRTEDDLSKLLQQAEDLGISKAVGLWQEVNPPAMNLSHKNNKNRSA